MRRRENCPICLPGRRVFCRLVEVLSLSKESGQWGRTQPTKAADTALRYSLSVVPTSTGSGPQCRTVQANAVLSKRTCSRSLCHPTDLQFHVCVIFFFSTHCSSALSSLHMLWGICYWNSSKAKLKPRSPKSHGCALARQSKTFHLVP